MKSKPVSKVGNRCELAIRDVALREFRLGMEPPKSG